MDGFRTSPRPARPLTILVGVVPQLLADALVLMLRREGFDVVVLLDGPSPHEVRPVEADVALVSAALAGDIIADTILEVAPDGRSVTVTGEGHEGEAPIDARLGALLGFVEHLIAAPAEG